LSSVYFIFFKQLPYHPRGESNNIQPTSTDFIDLKTSFTEEDVKNSELTELPYIEDLKFQRVGYMNKSFSPIKFVDGKAQFEYCNVDVSCQYDTSGSAPTSAKIAHLTIEKAVFPNSGISMNNNQFGGDLNGAAIFNIDLEGKVHRFLVTFHIEKRDQINNSINFFHQTSIDKEVKNIQIEDGPIFKLTYSNNSTDLFTYAALTRGDSSFTRITSDGKFKIYENKRDGITFKYPSDADAYMYYYQSIRAWGAEQYNAVKPIFYSDACGLENSFSDFNINLSKATYDPSLYSGRQQHYYMNFGITNPDFETMYLTSASWGYNADDWNKILSTLKYKNYLDAVKSGKTLSGEPTTQLNIAGKKINYIPEKKLPRPCDEWNFDQYIWAEKDRVFTLRVRNNDTPKQEMDKIISDLIGSINVTE
jgi:hypothetical protein